MKDSACRANEKKLMMGEWGRETANGDAGLSPRDDSALPYISGDGEIHSGGHAMQRMMMFVLRYYESFDVRLAV